MENEELAIVSQAGNEGDVANYHAVEKLEM